MEKEIGSKEVKMQAKEQPQKLSYEELNQACAELSQQVQQQNKYIQQCHKQMQEMQGMLQVKRMDYLMKIVEMSKTEGCYKFDSDFVTSCIKEIQESMTIPATEEEEVSKKN